LATKSFLSEEPTPLIFSTATHLKKPIFFPKIFTFFA
jgi:hypothetical protein